jgi:CRP/FNR family transcriptional regulator, anaerobic regulatory protein
MMSAPDTPNEPTSATLATPPSWLRALTDTYPALAAVGAPAVDRDLLPWARYLKAPARTTLFSEQAPCPGFPLVLRGEVRVARQASDGRQLELYRVGPGDLCVISTCSLYGSIPLSAHGETTLPTELVVLTPAGFNALNQHAAFRRFVFGVFGDRLAELAGLAEAIAFQRLDQRLAQALLGHGPARLTTHQALAQELGTVREAVTRLLKRFEQQGWVRLGRERIDVLDAASLRRLASGTPLA